MGQDTDLGGLAGERALMVKETSVLLCIGFAGPVWEQLMYM